MGKQKNKKGNPLYRGLKGWEINYLKQAEKYGHLDTRGSSKHTSKRRKGE